VGEKIYATGKIINQWNKVYRTGGTKFIEHVEQI
jgi:hypothetical protein